MWALLQAPKPQFEELSGKPKSLLESGLRLIRPDNSAERRRNALSMAVLILVAGGLWLFYLRHHPAVVVRPVPERSIPHA